MVQLLSFLNIIVLFASVYILFKQYLINDSKPLRFITTMLVCAAAISFFYYLSLVLRANFTVFTIGLLLVNMALVFYAKQGLIKLIISGFSQLLSIDIWALGAIFVLTCFFVLQASKYGGSDAWGIWNIHAKFVYDHQLWRNLSSKGNFDSHPDYPLMVSSLVAFGWHTFNTLSTNIPLLLCYTIYITIPLTVFYALKEQDLFLYGILALAIFIADPTYKQIGMAQEADALLSLFILSVFIQFKKLTGNDDLRIFLLGLLCASCGWIKNEGLVFSLLFTMGFIIINYKQTAVLKKYLLGIAIPMLTIASYKLFFTPPNDLFAHQHHVSSLAKLTDISRYTYILKSFVMMFLTKYYMVVVLIITMLIFNKKRITFPIVVFVLMLGVYFLVYLLTPHNLQWHVFTSLSRLFQQFCPAFIYIAFLSLKGVDRQNLVFSKIFGTQSLVK